MLLQIILGDSGGKS